MTSILIVFFVIILSYSVIVGAKKKSDYDDGCGIPEDVGQRIMNGVPVKTNKYPWLVGIRNANNTNVFGGGSLISPRHVLTAAHNFHGKEFRFSPYELYPAEKLMRMEYLIGFINVAEKEIPNNREVFHPLKYNIHPEFAGMAEKLNMSDIAIVTLDCPVPPQLFSNGKARLICLPTMKTKLKKKFTIAGWGEGARITLQNWDIHRKKAYNFLDQFGKKNEQLQEAKAEFYDFDQCNATRFSATKKSLPLDSFCITALFQDVCHGDSGSPLIQENSKTGRYTVVGVASFGSKCSKKGNNETTGGAFTDVRRYADWIQTIINQES